MNQLIDTDVLERVLASALRTGGEFAEVFAEDRANSSALFDDGRVEELTSGRERGAGIRVISGDTTGFAHTADLSEAGLMAAAEGATITGGASTSSTLLSFSPSWPGGVMRGATKAVVAAAVAVTIGPARDGAGGSKSWVPATSPVAVTAPPRL